MRGSKRPLMGSRCRVIPRTNCKIMPSQKTGMLMEESATILDAWSGHLSLKTAAAIAMGNPMITPRMVDTTTNSKVAGKYRLMSMATGWRFIMDVPRLPFRTPFM